MDHELEKNKKCLSVGNFEVLSVDVVCSASKTCKMARFLISNTFLLMDGNTALCMKKNVTKMNSISLVTHCFTKPSRNVCLINTHILNTNMSDVTASYGTPFDFIAFFGHSRTQLTSIHV